MVFSIPRWPSLALVFFLALLVSVPVCADDAPVPQSKEAQDARMAWWRDARYGMFIHWSLFSVSAGTWNGQKTGGFGEWILHDLRIPVADYQAQVSKFNPTQFDADQWVSLAKAAGMKYIVITAKHHDGFAMFKSSDPFNIVDATPYHHDPMKDLAAACSKYGLKLGFYYSQDQDWTAPGGAVMFGGKWDKEQEGDFGKYIDTKVVPQLQELLTNYQPWPAVIWFDTPTHDMTPALADKIRAVMKQHPDVLYNDRLGAQDQGDWATPEGYVPALGYKRDWETCMNINNTWGYKSFDVGFKSVEQLTRNLIDIASKGGNYLLNVGPTPEGVIPQPEVDRVLGVGKWLSVNGDAIYGTQASPFRRFLPWGKCTRKGNTLYFSVFDWPKDGKLTLPIGNHGATATLLANGANVPLEETADGAVLTLPAAAPDPIASVVMGKLNEPVQPIDQDLKQAPDGTFVLKAEDADLEGSPINIQTNGGEANIAYWVDLSNFAHWSVFMKKPGTFNVTMNYALDPNSKGSAAVLSAGNQSLTFSPATTADWNTYVTASLGQLTLGEAGKGEIVLKALRKPGEGVVNVRSITLTPVAP